MIMLRINIVLACLTVLFVVQFPQTSNGNCDPSSCGNIRNISYPFRLKDDPKNCGDSRFELACEDNLTVLYLMSSQKYYVQAINYNNFTIRLADPGVQKDNCSSLPHHSLAQYNFGPRDPYSRYKPKWNISENFPQLTKPITFINCPYPVVDSISPLYVDTAPCVNGSGVRHYSYLKLGSLRVSDVRDLCSIELMVMTSWPFKVELDDDNVSFSDIQKALVYGFELSWFKLHCKNCRQDEYCYYRDDANNVTCFNRGNICIVLGVEASSWPCGTLDYLTAIGIWLLYLLPYFIGLHIAARIVCGIPCAFIFFIYTFRRRHLSMFDTIESYLRSQNNLMPIRYSYSEIQKITKGFKDKLGEGGYGCVYKGKLRSSPLVAVKLLSKPKTNGQEFINEVATIGRIHHVNVVQLLGFCAERSKRALVYEFMPNGSLDKYVSSRERNLSLSWERKYAIVLGVARGIEYLHRGCDIQILHFDIKPHNILLDENYVPKVSDFGLAKLYPTDNSIVSLTAARGTIGYVAPELINRSIGGVSYKADVYSFGMLLMEMVGLKKNLVATDENSSQYFPSWIYDQFKNRNDIEMGEETEEEKKITRKLTLVSLWCIQMNPVDRPSMTKVVEMLEGAVELLPMPPDQAFHPPQNASFQDQTWSGDSDDSLALLSNSLNLVTLDATIDCEV